MMRRCAGFTLLEMLLAIFIAAMVITLAIPSVSGVLTEQKMKRSFEAFNSLAMEARRMSMNERRSYRILWQADMLRLEPADVGDLEVDGESETVQLDIEEEESFTLALPAALIIEPPSEWTFWPNGTCEPAVVTYRGENGNWQATYDPLTCTADFRTDLQ